MTHIDKLEKKVRQAAEQLIIFREENNKLKEKLQFLEEDNKRAKDLENDNYRHQDNNKIIKNRVEKLIKRLNSLNLR